jgi:hypothetical protein
MLVLDVIDPALDPLLLLLLIWFSACHAITDTTAVLTDTPQHRLTMTAEILLPARLFGRFDGLSSQREACEVKFPMRTW